MPVVLLLQTVGEFMQLLTTGHTPKHILNFGGILRVGIYLLNVNEEGTCTFFSS